MTHIKFSFKLLFVLLTVACQRQTDELILYLHDEWQFKKAGTDSLHKAKIPGEIHTDLLRVGLIPDPFYRDNEYKLQWIGKTNWEYQTTFSKKIKKEFSGGYFSDNYFNIIPGQSVVVEFIPKEQITQTEFENSLKIRSLVDAFKTEIDDVTLP